MLSCRLLGINAKKRLCKEVLVPNALYGAEGWNMEATERRRINVMEIKCLRNMCGVIHIDRVRNEEVRRKIGVVREFADSAEQGVLRWFGHVQRMEEEHLVKKITIADVRC